MTTEASRVHRLLMDFESRIAWLERIVSCPRCHGTGTISTHDGPDECPECHGSKINPVLAD